MFMPIVWQVDAHLYPSEHRYPHIHSEEVNYP